MSFIKLDNIFGGDIIYITQGFHGKAQRDTAMDFKAGALYAPLDGCKVEYLDGSGGQTYFGIKLPVNGNVIIQCVHGRPTKPVGATFQKGEIMGVTLPFFNKQGGREDHWHIAIQVNNVWHALLSYIRRDVKLALLGTPWVNPYDQWSFYKDRSLFAPNLVNPPLPTEQKADNDTEFTPPTTMEPEKQYIDMYSQLLIDTINSDSVLSQQEKELHVTAITQNNPAYAVAWLGTERIQEIAKLQAQLQELQNSTVNNQNIQETIESVRSEYAGYLSPEQVQQQIAREIQNYIDNIPKNTGTANAPSTVHTPQLVLPDSAWWKSKTLGTLVSLTTIFSGLISTIPNVYIQYVDYIPQDNVWLSLPVVMGFFTMLSAITTLVAGYIQKRYDATKMAVGTYNAVAQFGQVVKANKKLKR